MTDRSNIVCARREVPSLPSMGRVANSLLAAGWGEPCGWDFPPTRRPGRLGSAKIGRRRPPHVGGGMNRVQRSAFDV